MQLLKIISGAKLPTPVLGTNYLSDFDWLASSITPQPPKKDQAFDLAPLTLHGVVYSKGLGVLPAASLDYYLAGLASRFQSDIGVDAAAGSVSGGVVFRLHADGKKIYDSGIVTGQSPVQSIDVDVSGVNILRLETVSAGASGTNYADWAGARVLAVAAPAGLLATAAGSGITLAWNAAPGATNYIILRSTSTGGPYLSIGGSIFASFTDTNVLPDTIYYYEVSSVNPAANGQPTNSAPVSVAMPVVGPTRPLRLRRAGTSMAIGPTRPRSPTGRARRR